MKIADAKAASEKLKEELEGLLQNRAGIQPLDRAF